MYNFFQVDDEISNIIICGSMVFVDSSGTQVNIPFKVKIHCLDILIPVTDGLQDLLSTGALKAAKSQKKTWLLMTNFDMIMDAIEDRTKFAPIEKTDNGTFLFAKHFRGSHIAIMLKFTPSDKTLTIEGKATDPSTLTAVMSSVSDILM